MLRGIFTGASGMIAMQHRLDAVANNLANVDTAGYKKDIAVFKAFPELLLRRSNDNGVYTFPMGSVDTMPMVGRLGAGVELNEVYTTFEQGSMKPTGNDFDMALDGKGFFSVRTQSGERYTRNGAFYLNNEGSLVDKAGDFVLGENGPVVLQQYNFMIDQDGVIWRDASKAGEAARLVSPYEVQWENMERVDRLKIVDFAEPRYIRKQGDSYWLETPESGPATVVPGNARPKVRTGYLEASNVNAVREMVDMIEVNRAYDANSKSIQTHDTLVGRLINEIGRV
ncbi:MAG: flagellar basal-body rod protein FlgF [Spirochaetales bacterium]|nr:flagellar basal-body rod protein FlgF [Spirochaetales bacterium]